MYECVVLVLQRGKFRPRLSELVKENSPADVERITEEGLARLPGSLTAAVKHLSQLKGVGPATASGVCYIRIYNHHQILYALIYSSSLERATEPKFVPFCSS